MRRRRILVTAALPYANGPIHLGHLVEYIQTDIWARFQKLRGHHCIYICADDTHGTAIMIRARQEGRGEEELIAQMQQEHERDFATFQIEFDNYGSTHSRENRAICGQIWQAFRQAGLVRSRDVQQLYDAQAQTFLADRFVVGTCPICRSENQPGDNCSNCGGTYTPAEIIDPVSVLSGTRPEIRSAPHLFIELEQLHDFLEEWTQSGEHLQPEIANYLKGHFLGDPESAEGRKRLRDWDISRPAPYFGFEIPDAPGHYWYVWFDAPVGYIASTQQWCRSTGQRLEDWWNSDETEIHHFIGKDITYFHTLFWPGMLKVAGFSLPTKIHIHGFLTINGAKMSKRTGTFVRAATYARHLDPSLLRYFYATKLGPRLDDLDLSLEEFVNRVNADLVNNVVNLASRCAKFARTTGLSARYPDDNGLFAQSAALGDEIAAAYEACDYNRATRLIMDIAYRANAFVEGAEPWKLNKDPGQAQRLQDVCTIALNQFRHLAIYLAPVLPQLAEQAGELLNDPIRHWDQARAPLIGVPVSEFKHLLQRITLEEASAMIEDSKQDNAAPQPAAPADSDQPLRDDPISPEITIEDFAKVDLRIARVVAAEHVPEANKLLKLTLSLGGEQRRTVFAGIKQAYEPSELLNRLVVMVANLKPRQMKFGLSEGMVCASGPGGADVFVLGVDEGAVPGQRVK
jgi:methionyl-tRNA synthetase